MKVSHHLCAQVRGFFFLLNNSSDMLLELYLAKTEVCAAQHGSSTEQTLTSVRNRPEKPMASR